jgi:hypothetical protein
VVFNELCKACRKGTKCTCIENIAVSKLIALIG